MAPTKLKKNAKTKNTKNSKNSTSRTASKSKKIGAKKASFAKKSISSKKTAALQKSADVEKTSSQTSSTLHNHTVESPTSKELPKGSDKYSIEVTEGPENRYFVIKVNNYRNFFSLEEMRNIVKICHQAGEEREGMQRLYWWFKHFRQDVIVNTKIEGPSDPALKTIFNYLISTYTVKKT